MNIAVFIKSTTFHKGFGGLETQNKALCEGLASRGHTLTVFSPKKELSMVQTSLNGVDYVFIESVYQYFLSEQKPNSWFNCSLAEFRKLHSLKPFDLVLSQSSAGISIIRNKAELGVKVISIAHGTSLGELSTSYVAIKDLNTAFLFLKNTQYFLRQYFGRQREYILHSNRVIAVSNAVKSSLIDETFISDQKVIVIHNGMDSAVFTAVDETKKRDGKFNILYVGQILKEKGVLALVDFAMAPQLANAFFTIVGGGLDAESLKNKITRYGCADKFNIMGKVTSDQVVNLLNTKHFDAFVFPTQRREGFPMVLVEAMMAGIPIVATNVGGIADAVEDGKTGYLIKPYSEQTFIDRLTQLSQDAKLQELMAHNAKIKAQTEFNLKVMLDKYENAFAEVLK